MKHRPKPPAALVEKLHPRRFSGCSPKWCAIVGYILGQDWTDPAIAEMAVTSDGCVLARHKGDVGMNDFMGAQEDLWNNWRRYLTAAGLTTAEKRQAQRLFDAAVTKHGDERWIRENPSRSWVTSDGTHVRGGDLIEFWDMNAYHRGEKKKRVARVNRLLVFDDHVIAGGGMGEYVDDDNFIRVVSKRREV